MKYSQLSNFQKQQYTNYLETQLEKFSSFMLAQRKENEKYRILEDAIAFQTDSIAQIRDKLQLMELYQMQNHASFEHQANKITKIEDMESRLRRLEDRQRFGCDDQSNLKRNRHHETAHNQSEREEEHSRLDSIERKYKECLKIMKRQQNELTDCQDALQRIRRKRGNQTTENETNPESAIEKKDLKRLQKRLVRYFNEKIEEVETHTNERKNKSSKSPSVKPGELSIIDNYTIKESKNAISSFRIDDQATNKSEMSTILEPRSTRNSKLTQKSDKHKMKKKISSRSKSKGKSQSKSRSKSQSPNDCSSKSKSKTKHKIDKSLNMSNESIFLTSKSRSKSHTSKHQKQKSIDSKVSKRSKLSKKIKNSISKEKSHSNSHDLCKKRPDLHPNLPKKQPQKRKESSVLRKRRPLGPSSKH